MDERACKNCEFWDGEEKVSHNDPNGLCRRRSPTGLNQRYNWPLTNCEDWCGEFLAKDKGDRHSCVAVGQASATSCADLRSCLDCRHYNKNVPCTDGLGICGKLLPLRYRVLASEAFLYPWYPGGENECKSWEKRQEEQEESCDNCWHKNNGAHCITMRSPCESYTKDDDRVDVQRTCGNCWHYRSEDGDCYEEDFTKACENWEPINAVKECDSWKPMGEK